MPQSIYENGGMVGVTLDLNATDRYITGTTTGPATIQFVGGTSLTAHGDSITLPTGLQQGDLVIIASTGDTGQPGLPTGFTLGQGGDTGSVGYSWSYKFMGATPDSTATGLGTSTTQSNLAMAFRGVDQSVPFAVQSSVVPSGTTGMPNPPSLTSVPMGSVAVAIGFLDDDRLSATVTAPSGYTLAAASESSVAGSTVMAAYKVAAENGIYDAGVFGGSGDDAWQAAAFALKQGTTTSTTYGNLKNSGIWGLDAALESAVDLMPNESSIYAVQHTEVFSQHGSTSVSAIADLGTAYTDREIWIAVPTMVDTATASTATGLTVAGNAATLVAQTGSPASDNSIGISYWKYVDNGVLGATATIAATFSSTQVYSAFIVFTTTPSSGLLDYYASTAAAGAATSGVLSTSNGWAFYTGMSQNSSSSTIANFDNDFSFDIGSGEWVTFGFISPTIGASIDVLSPSGIGSGSNMISAIAVA